jgi:hypothetical protein
MPLFPEDQPPSRKGGPDASQRMFWTREGGTRRLVLAFVGLLAAWFCFDKIQDHFLLARHWKPLSADLTGLSVVGTLDARGSYERNMFRVVQANKEFKVELTDFGWRTIFDPKNGSLFSGGTASAIKRACDLDDLTGYAMLEPFLISGVARLQGISDWRRKVVETIPITVQGTLPGTSVNKGTLGQLIAKYSDAGALDRQGVDTTEGGGSGTTHDVEHGMTLPAETVARVCPVVLTGALFNSVDLEEHPANLIGGKTWTLHLGLTSEGRSRFYQWSHDHVNENLVFVLNREVMAAGRVPETLDVSEWGVGPLHDEETVHRLEAYVRKLTKQGG